MTVARSQLVDTNVTPWYHVISGTVRGALLLGEGGEGRKQWIENRLEELASIFAIEVAGFAVLDSHLHVLVHLSPAGRTLPKTRAFGRSSSRAAGQRCRHKAGCRTRQ